MTVPWPLLVALVAPASVGLIYGVAVKLSGRTLSLGLLAFEVSALILLLVGWLFLAATAAGD